jgi:hypothetical protein
MPVFEHDKDTPDTGSIEVATVFADATKAKPHQTALSTYTTAA